MNKHSFWFVNRIFLLKILVPAFLTLVLFIVSLYQIILPRFEELALDRKREMTRELIRSAWHIAYRYDREVRNGNMPLADAQAWVVEQISNLRYGPEGKDYFWITDFHPTMVAHPFRTDLNGKDLTNFRDSHGKRLFVDMVTTVRNKGEGFVDYTWQWKDDSTRIVPKLSYVKSYKPWGWIIGTGMYIEDVTAEIAELERNIVVISIWITVAICLLMFFMAIQNLRSERKRLEAESNLLESKEKYQALVESTTEGLLMLLDDSQPYFNKTLLDMLGLNDEDAASIRLEHIFPDITLDKALFFDTPQAQLDSDAQHIETQLVQHNGSRLDVLLTWSPVTFFEKQGVVVTVKDIRSHKQIVNELDESKEKFMALTNRLSLAVFRTDATKDMKFMEANSATAALFEYEGVASMLDTAFADRFGDNHDFSMLYKELLDTGTISNRIVRCTRKNSSTIVLALSIVLDKDEQGSARYCDCMAEDVSDKQKTEQYTDDVLSWLQAPMMYLNQPVAPFVKEAGVCGMHDRLEKVARLLSKFEATSMLVASENGSIIGMISNNELRDCLGREGGGASKHAFEAMRSPVPTVSAAASVYDALERYMGEGIRSFGIRNSEGGIRGLVQVEDLLKSQMNNHLYFLQRLQRAESIAEIRQCQAQLQMYVRMLIERGATAVNVTATTTMIADAVTKALLRLGIEVLGDPPAPFAFISLGSVGRCEPTLVTDQDNAIIFEEPAGKDSAEIKQYFLSLGEYVCNALDSVGYSFCKGNVMAKNPAWCASLNDWKKYFHDWVNTANPQDLLDINIFFDFRHVHGEATLTEALTGHLRKVTAGNNAFFVYLTQNALKIKPPSWQFKPAEFIDMKSALLPMIDLTRIYALKHKVNATNTMQRMLALREREVFSDAGHRDMAQAYMFLMQLRYQHQARLLGEHAAANNNVSTHQLSETEKLVLKRVFSQIEDFQTKLSLDFKGTM